MRWYGGSIAEAVTLSKQKNAIFVVFVEGDNDLSTEMAATIEDAAVVTRLSNQANFLAIKLKSGTTNYTHFAQIYQFVPVPSLFFIGRNGTPLEVVCAGVEPVNLATRIDRILAEHNGEKPPMQASTSSSQGIHNATIGLLQAEASASAPVNIPGPAKAAAVPEAPSPPKFPKQSSEVATEATTTSGKEYEVVCDGDVCVRRPKAADQPSTSQAPVAPTVPLVTPTAPVVTPTAPVATPTAPVVTPTVPVVTPMTVAPSVIAPAPTPVANSGPHNVPEASSSETSVDEKLERAKELIEAKRREKTEQEKELERQKELERRTTGQAVSELKRWQADQEMKQLQDERKREKLENSLAKQRILEQIAQDRAERRARDNLPAPAPLSPPAAGPQATSHLPTSGDAGAGARVQFKLPDGTSHTAHFDAGGSLADVQRYVADNLQLSSSTFSLWTAFPRRELTAPLASLRELELAPSAALLVLPRQRAAGAPKQHLSLYAFISHLLSAFVYQPSLALYSWLRTRLFPPPAVSPRPANDPQASPAPSTGPVPRAGPLPRRRTNIHRIPGDAASDDDNNTWNGNSTQQM